MRGIMYDMARTLAQTLNFSMQFLVQDLYGERLGKLIMNIWTHNKRTFMYTSHLTHTRLSYTLTYTSRVI